MDCRTRRNSTRRNSTRRNILFCGTFHATFTPHPPACGPVPQSLLLSAHSEGVPPSLTVAEALAVGLGQRKHKQAREKMNKIEKAIVQQNIPI